jgi:ABC-2 type transport system permease protein
MGASIRVYWEIAKRAFQRQLAYRTANIAGLVTNAFFGYIRAAILVAAVAGAGSIAGYDEVGMVTFTWVTQALIMVVNLWGNLEVSATIRSGEVVSDLAKPLSYLGYWLSREYGRATYFLLFRCAPILLVGQVMFGLRWPVSPVTWLAVAVSVVLAVAVSFGWCFMVELTGFWTIQTRGIRQLSMGVVLFMSGFVVPVRLFPDWLRALSLALPFTSITQIPCDVFLERLTGMDLAAALARQAFWAACLLLAAQGLVAIATRRVVTQGG